MLQPIAIGILIIAIVAAMSAFILWALTPRLPDHIIRQRPWKFYDDFSDHFPGGDFLHLEDQGALRNDTLFKNGKAFATVRTAYKRLDGNLILKILLIDDGRVVEYIGK